MEKITWSEARKFGKNVAFKNHAKPGSVESWRHKRFVGGTPNGRIAMSEITPFKKDPTEGLVYCQCEYAVMDSQTHNCTKCGDYFDVSENKKLVEYKIVGV